MARRKKAKKPVKDKEMVEILKELELDVGARVVSPETRKHRIKVVIKTMGGERPTTRVVNNAVLYLQREESGIVAHVVEGL